MIILASSTGSIMMRLVLDSLLNSVLNSIRNISIGLNNHSESQARL